MIRHTAAWLIVLKSRKCCWDHLQFTIPPPAQIPSDSQKWIDAEPKQGFFWGVRIVSMNCLSDLSRQNSVGSGFLASSGRYKKCVESTSFRSFEKPLTRAGRRNQQNQLVPCFGSRFPVDFAQQIQIQTLSNTTSAPIVLYGEMMCNSKKQFSSRYSVTLWYPRMR